MVSDQARKLSISFLYGPFVVLLAFRFTPRETATGIFILTSIAIWGTLHGLGPFVLDHGKSVTHHFANADTILAITAMALTAGMAERRRAEAAIEHQRGRSRSRESGER